MRIACLLENESYGGSVQMLLWVADSMAGKGHFVTIFTVCSSKTIRVSAPNCSFVDFGEKDRNEAGRTPKDHVFLLQRMKESLKELNPDIVINFGDHVFYFGLLLRKCCGYKYIISERIDPYTSRNKNDLIRRKLYNICDGAVFQTRKAQEFFSKKLRSKSTVIPNPVKKPTTKRWDTGNVQNAICFFGRLDNFQKRLDVLVNAFAEVHRTLPDLRLDIWGSGNESEKEKLSELIFSCNLQNNILLKGPSKNVLEDMIQYKMLVFTSDYEGIPNVIIEAMSIGMPIVATDCSPGGAAMLLGEGENGVLVDRGDIKGIASAILALIADAELSVTYGQKAVKSLNRFKEEDIADQWENYLTLIGETND